MEGLKISNIDEMCCQKSLFRDNETETFEKVISPLYNKLISGNLCENGTVEVFARQMILDPMQPFLDFKGVRKSNKKYIQKELDWYLSEDLSIIGHVDDIKIWNQCCTQDDKKEVNSNYGYLLFNKGNGYQYQNCLKTLRNDKSTRNAIINYNRPSIYSEYLRNGMHDMICTMFSHFAIRENKLDMAHVMRSNDLIFGYINDFAWNCFVYQNMYLDLKETYPDLETGNIYWQSDSMHVYERHFEVLKNIVEAFIGG